MGLAGAVLFALVYQSCWDSLTFLLAVFWALTALPSAVAAAVAALPALVSAAAAADAADRDVDWLSSVAMSLVTADHV